MLQVLQTRAAEQDRLDEMMAACQARSHTAAPVPAEKREQQRRRRGSCGMAANASFKQLAALWADNGTTDDLFRPENNQVGFSAPNDRDIVANVLAKAAAEKAEKSIRASIGNRPKRSSPPGSSSMPPRMANVQVDGLTPPDSRRLGSETSSAGATPAGGADAPGAANSANFSRRRVSIQAGLRTLLSQSEGPSIGDTLANLIGTPTQHRPLTGKIGAPELSTAHRNHSRTLMYLQTSGKNFKGATSLDQLNRPLTPPSAGSNRSAGSRGASSRTTRSSKSSHRGRSKSLSPSKRINQFEKTKRRMERQEVIKHQMTESMRNRMRDAPVEVTRPTASQSATKIQAMARRRLAQSGTRRVRI